MSQTSLTPVAERLLLLDARTGRLVWQRRYPLRRGQWEAHLQFSPDGALISSAQQGETLVWDARAGRIVRRYPIGGRFGALARRPPARRRAQQPLSGRPELLRGHPGPAHRSSHANWPPSCPTSGSRASRSRATGRGSSARPRSGTHVWDIASGTIVETLWGRARRAAGGAVLDRRGLVIDSRDDGSLGVWDPDGARRLGHRFALDLADAHLLREPVHGRRSARRPDGDQPRRRHGRPDRPAQQAAHRAAARRERRVRRGARLHARRPRLVTGGTPRTVTIWDVRSQRGRAPDALLRPGGGSGRLARRPRVPSSGSARGTPRVARRGAGPQLG